MKPIHGITAMVILLVVAAGATAHHVYETRLSSGYAPILQAAMNSSYEERTAYIHEARVAVRTDKARAVGAPKPAVREMHNDKSKSKDKSNKECGARTPGGVATRDPEASHDGASV